MDYVLGFMVSKDRQSVALICKTKPEWMRGLLNGIGGKVEDGEAPRVAMAREFREETGYETDAAQWDNMGTVVFSGGEIHCYRMIAPFSPYKNVLRSPTEEPVGWFFLRELHLKRVVDNVRWLAELAASRNAIVAFRVMTGNAAFSEPSEI